MGMPVIEGGELARCQTVVDIIESVALQQTALAHILNAEGEKLQAIIASADVTPDRLLAANRSVQMTVQSITRLEMMLQAKLCLFKDALATSCQP